MAVAAASSPHPQKLRVGLFARSRLQPRWIADAFARVAASPVAEIALIVCPAEPGETAAPALPLLWRLYGRMDRIAFRTGPDLGSGVDLPGAVAHRKLKSGSGTEWPPDLPELDVAFALDELDPVQEAALARLARYGVWRFCFGEQDEQPEALAGLAEVAADAPLTRSALTVRVAGAPARLAYQSWSRTYPFSAARNRSQMLRKTAHFALRALRELQRSGPAWLDQCKPVPEKQGQTTVSFEGNRGLSPILGRIARRGVEKALNVEQWFLAYRLRESRFGDERSVPGDLKGYTRLMPPKDRYWADPFVMQKDGRYYVFFEELPFKTGKAHISVLEIDAAGRASTPVRVLERDYHLSYPFLVEDAGALYMIPETAQGGTVEVYRCVEFPHRWRLERVLLSGLRCVDATFHRGADRWWMFANLGSDQSSVFDDELHLFHSERLLGDWRPHPRNPIKSDVRGARPAGQLFTRNGALYRPAQICAPLYGAGMSIHRVLRLTPNDYAERQVERILPSRKDGILGIHTLNRAGDLTVVDAFARRPRL